MSGREDIAVSYDVDNEFFRLWLDRRMSYTCALFEDGDDLAAAQRRKLDWHYASARLSPEKTVLDIGCGWGAAMQHFVERGVAHATGITLSAAQHREIVARDIPNSSVHCLSYTDFEPNEPFDAAVSIGMFEHVATPEQRRDGSHIEIYRRYFKLAKAWTKPGAWFSLQTVISTRYPRRGADLQELAWATREIFPGAITPRLEDIAAAVNPHWEIVTVQTRREHYARTTAHWLANLRAHEATIRHRWGDARFEQYERYLCACVSTFRKGYQSLAQLSLRRVDEKSVLPSFSFLEQPEPPNER